MAHELITNSAAIYHGDCVEVMSNLPDKSIGYSVYSLPFAGLYKYTSDPRDMSNCSDHAEFLQGYRFSVMQKTRLTAPGRLSTVHCMDTPVDGGMIDLPGDIIRIHQELGWTFVDRKSIWKEPRRVALRLAYPKHLKHKQLVADSSFSTSAAADQLVTFRRSGENAHPIAHPYGLTDYAGSAPIIPRDDQPQNAAAAEWQELLRQYSNYSGDQGANKLSHKIWQRYASSWWDDIRIERVLPFVEARDEDDESHVHPLQLDVIERCLTLWSNPGDTVLTPFMGVGSEVYGAVTMGRRGVGIELKESYYNQAVKNLERAEGEWSGRSRQLLIGETVEQS